MSVAQTDNSALNDATFGNYEVDTVEKMAIQDTTNKTGILVLLAILSSSFIWNKFDNNIFLHNLGY